MSTPPSDPQIDMDRLTPKPGPSPWLFVVFVVLAFGCMAGAIIMPILSSANTSYSERACMTNLHELAKAGLMYADDNDGFLPVKGWNEPFHKYVPDDLTYACPVQRRLDPQSSGYALSSEVAGKERAKLEKQDTTVFFFDSQTTALGATAAPSDLARPGRHKNGRTNNVVYLDGRVASSSR
jgi:prepilin-type processing-associated H-X9-DG protein